MNGGNARLCTGNARVHFFGRRMLFAAVSAKPPAEAAKLDAAIAANLKELGYGG